MIVSQVYSGIARISSRPLIVHMNYIIEGEGILVNEKGEEQPLKAGRFCIGEPR